MQQRLNVKQIACFVGAAAMLLLAILKIDYLIARIVYIVQGYGGGSYIFSDFLGMAGYAAIAVCLLLMGLRKESKALEIVIFAGTCALLMSKIAGLTAGFTAGTYWVWGNDYFEMSFTFFGMLPNILKVIAYAVLVAIAAVAAFSAQKRGIENLWFIAPVLILIANILTSGLNVIYRYNWGGYNAFSGGGFGQILLEIIATLALGLILANPQLIERFSKTNGADSEEFAEESQGQGDEHGFYQNAENLGFDGEAQNTQSEGFSEGVQDFDSGSAQNTQTRYYSAPPQMPEGYCDMLKHVLLLIFTFGIWRLIWVYRTTEFLNRMPQEPRRSGTCQLLLCLFVPFYDIYWVYKSCQRIDKLSYYNNIRGEITLMCVLFQVFIPILSPIFMQDKLNNIVTK